MEEIVYEPSNYLMFDSQLYAGVNNPTTPVPASRNYFDELPIMSGMLTSIDMFWNNVVKQAHQDDSFPPEDSFEEK